jgi:hypothetical protein
METLEANSKMTNGYIISTILLFLCLVVAGRTYSAMDSHRVPLDLNALFPIPRRVLRKGFGESGQEWMWRNWGVRWPIRRVTFALERRDASGLKPVAVFRFLSEDWSPWIALLRMRERWPELSFKLIPSYYLKRLMSSVRFRS